MPKKLFDVPFTISLAGAATILADSPEEALRLAEKELIIDDGTETTFETRAGFIPMDQDGPAVFAPIEDVVENTDDLPQDHPDFDPDEGTAGGEPEGSGGEKR